MKLNLLHTAIVAAAMTLVGCAGEDGNDGRDGVDGQNLSLIHI